MAAIGDFVWLDQNTNGIQEVGEPGLAAVQVTLYRADGTFVATMITDSSGFYRFTGVNPGDYYLVFTAPSPNGETYLLSPPGQGVQPASDAIDSDAVGVAGAVTSQTAVFSLAPGETTLVWDVGFYPPLQIGNRVWHDKNNNGQVDDDEEGLPNVTLHLFRAGDDPGATAPLATTTTDVTGAYHFGNLPPGQYFVYLPSPPAGYPLSSAATGLPADNDKDNDDNGDQTASGGPIRSSIITLTVQGEPSNDGDGANSNQSVDFGFFAFGSIGDLVWYDRNRDGIQDAGETDLTTLAGIVDLSGVTVTLYAADGNTVVATTTIDSQGHYRFDGLWPGNYYVHFEVPPTYQLSLPHVGTTNEALDSDVDQASHITAVINLESAENELTLDLGLYLLPSSISGHVWFDSNNNGIRDSDEPTMPTVEVMLFMANGALIATTVTDNSGHYQFVDLLPSEYYLIFSTPTDYQGTLPNQGGDDTLDSDVDNNGQVAQTPYFLLNAAEDLAAWDYGLQWAGTEENPLQPSASIGDLVWLDLNGNGSLEADENGVPGVAVRLYNAAGELIAVTVTDGNGLYRFTDLIAGSYFVEFVLPTDFVFSQLGATGRDSDSNADPTSGRTELFTLEAGVTDLSWDAGIHQRPTSLADGAEPDQPGGQVFLPLVSRKGIKVKPKIEEEKPVRIRQCDGHRCLSP